MNRMVVHLNTNKRGSSSDIIIHFVIRSKTSFVVFLAKWRQGSACQENDSFQLFVEEEVIETPERSIFPKRIRGEVGVVRVDVAVDEIDLLVEGDPEFVVDLAEQRTCRNTQKVVDIARHKL